MSYPFSTTGAFVPPAINLSVKPVEETTSQEPSPQILDLTRPLRYRGANIIEEKLYYYNLEMTVVHQNLS